MRRSGAVEEVVLSISKSVRLGAYFVSLITVVIAGGSDPVYSQNQSICQQLAFELRQLDDSATSQGYSQIFEQDINNQQIEIDKLVEYGRQINCNTNSGSQQCGRLLYHLERFRANLDELVSQARNSRSSLQLRDDIIYSMQVNRCKNSRIYATRGLVAPPISSESGSVSSQIEGVRAPAFRTYRTMCVRTCDGFYFPISFATTSDRFIADEQRCERRCPGQQTELYLYLNPGQEVEDAQSLDGTNYRDLPFAYRFRTIVDVSCRCQFKSGIQDSIQTNRQPGINDSQELFSPIRGSAGSNTVAMPEFRPQTLSEMQTTSARSVRKSDSSESQLPLEDFDPTGVRTVGPPFFPDP